MQPLPSARSWLFAAGLVLAACGNREDAPPTAPLPVEPGSWTSAAPMLEARQEVCVAAVGSRFYVAGGFRAGGSTANTVEVYDTATDRWSMAAPLPQGVNHCMAAALGNRVYVMGGALANGASTAATYEYDPAANAWATKAPMPTARNGGMAAVIADRIFVVGGAPGGQAVEAYTPATDRWTSLPAMPTPRDHLAGGAMLNQVYAVGGRPPLTLNVLEVLDPTGPVWINHPGMPTGRSGHAAAVVRGCLYVFGGEGNAAAASGTFPQNESHDPRSHAWTTHAPMPTPRHGIGSAVVGDRVFLPGGANVQGFGAVATHEVFTPPASRSCQ